MAMLLIACVLADASHSDPSIATRALAQLRSSADPDSICRAAGIIRQCGSARQKRAALRIISERLTCCRIVGSSSAQAQALMWIYLGSQKVHGERMERRVTEFIEWAVGELGIEMRFAGSMTLDHFESYREVISFRPEGLAASSFLRHLIESRLHLKMETDAHGIIILHEDD